MEMEFRIYKKIELKKIKLISIGSQKQFLTYQKVRNLVIPKSKESCLWVLFRNNTFAIPLNGSGPCSNLSFQTQILDVLGNLWKAEIYIKPHENYKLFKKN